SSQLTATLTGAGPWNLTYTDGVTPVLLLNILSSPHVWSVSPTVNKTYSLVSVSDACVGTVSGSRTVSILPVPTATLTSASANICAGGSAQQTLTLTGTGPWNTTYTDGVTPATILNITASPYVWTVSPIASRTYSLISVSDVCSGTVSGTRSVTILPTPTATLTSGNANICANTSSHLTINLTGNGPWNVNYTDGVSSSTINNISTSPYVFAVSPSVSRTYSLTSLNDACTGTVSGTRSVTILPTPAASLSGSNSICPGGSSQLTINFTGNGPWSVTYSNGSINTSLTGINSSPYLLSITPIINTTYNLVNVNDACSGSVSGVGVINLFTIPTAVLSGTQTINLGQSANLTLALTGSSPWQINYTDGTSTYSVTGITQSPYVLAVSPTQTSTYSLISVSDANCTGSGSGAAYILVNALPTATLSGSQTLCLGSAANLSIHLTGPAPWTVTYTDGVQPTTISGIVSSPYVFAVTPSQSITYSMVSVVNPYVGTVSGTAVLGVQVIPGIPMVLSATSPTCTGITLNWSGVSGATGYYLDVATDTSFVTFISGYQNRNMGSATQAILTGLTAGQTLYFRVRAAGVCGISPSSTRAQGSTLPIPSVITSSAASLVNCTGFVANWQNQMNATNYRLDVAYDTLFSSYVPSYQNLSVGNTTSYSVIGLTGGQNHYYRVRGENTCGTSNQSAVRTRVVTYNLRDSIVMGSNSPVCNGSTLQLTSMISIPGTTTDWTGPGGYQRLGQSQASLSSITQGQAGSYSLTVSYAGCTSVVLGTSVAVNLPVTQILLGGNTTLCAGEVLQLTSSGGNGTSTYHWRGPNGFSSTQQNPQIISITSPQAGVYSLIINSPGCGQLSDSILVSVTNSQNFTVGNNSPICEGATVYLSATNIGGTIYSWTGPNGFMDSGHAPFVLNATPLEAGIYTVTIAQPGCQNPLVYLTNVVVSPALNLNPQNNSPVCQGDTVQISVDLLQGLTYSWIGPNGFTGNQSSVVIPNSSPTLNGVYTVSGTSPGCGYFEDHFTVTVSPAPGMNAYANQVNICEGSNLFLYAGGNNQYAFYRWRGPNNYVASTPNPGILAVQANRAGVYTLQQVVPGCQTMFDTVEIWVSPNIQQQVMGGTNSPVCSGNAIILSATNLSGVSYLWSGPGGFTASGSSVTRNNATNGMAGLYTLTASAGGCSPWIQTFAVIVNNLSSANATSNSPVCGGGNLTLQGSGPRGSTFLWSGPNGFTSQLATETFAGAQYSQSGVYSLTVSLPSCGVATFTTTVQVGTNLNQSNVTSNLPVCIGNTLALSASYFPDATYLWTGPNGFTSAVGVDSIVGIQSSGNGAYQVTISTPGCLPVNRSQTVALLPVLTATASATTPVCQGNNLYLSGAALTGVNMVWAGPNGYTSIGTTPSITNVQPVQGGIYTLTASRTGCGIYTISVSVQVGGNLSGLVATSNSPVCVGQTLRLSATTISNATYSWTGPNGFTSNNQNDSIPSVSALYRGQYSLSVVSPGCVATSRITRIVVDTIPVLSPTSNSPICQGGTLLLSTQWPLNAGVVWQGPNSFNSTLRTPSLLNVPILNSGTYTLSVTTNCGVTTATTAVTVNPSLNSIVAGSNSPLCYGQTLRMTATTIPNATYSWAGPNGFTSGIEVDSIIGVTSLAAGEYTLSVVSSGCGGARIYTTRVVLSDPSGMIATGNSPICQGGTLQLSTGQIGGTLYNWSGPNGFTSSLRTPSLINILPVSGGLYTLVVAIPGCGQSTSTVNITVGNTFTGLMANTSSPVCVAGTLGLSSNQTLGTYAYQWLGPLGFTSNQAIASVSGLTTANAGVYTLRVTSPGCGMREITTSPVQVYNPASLTAASNTPCVGASLNLVGATLGSTVNYQWNGPGGFTFSGRIARRLNAQLFHSGVYTLSADVPGCGWVSTTRSATVVTCKLGNDAPVKNDTIVSTTDVKENSSTKDLVGNEAGSVLL
ncbi:MAG: fibronectin type III domain-containing protein, partial [Chitinophagia bacterium]|nr:fibronectin type III domain-containing protein [Chitinophagia bacterium]